ncbi:MAG: copper transporter [Armatimonadota bacterium]|nr:copper transporter [Armatimonadota bacterium]
MPDIRYHFIYLIAVFLMLGIGLLVGASFIGPDQVKRQTVYLRDLRVQAETAVTERRATQDQLTKLDATLDALRPALVRGKLAGRRVTLIQTGDYAEATQQAATALRDAGALPAMTLALGPKWQALTPDVRTADLMALAGALARGTPDALQPLEDQSLVTVTGSLTAPGSLFVLVGGGKDDAAPEAPLDGELIAQLQAQAGDAAHIVGCESFDAVRSFIPVYQSAQIPTVDCIDRPLGQLDLPFALRGGDDAADYGLKPTARRQTPPSLEAQPDS